MHSAWSLRCSSLPGSPFCVSSSSHYLDTPETYEASSTTQAYCKMYKNTAEQWLVLSFVMCSTIINYRILIHLIKYILSQDLIDHTGLMWKHKSHLNLVMVLREQKQREQNQENKQQEQNHENGKWSTI